MLPTKGYAIYSSHGVFEPFDFARRDPGTNDVVIEILYCGICHSDIHQARGEWNNSTYPMVPGHEILGRVTQIGSGVSKFKVGDLAGVGCFVDSCRICSSCKEGEEQLCENHVTYTYNSTEKDLKTPTYGGYSSKIVVDENYVLKISPNLPLANTAPLLCAGITTYSPLRRFNITSAHKVGVIGLGGLGHMAVKFAVAMGAEVTVFSTSKSKEKDALEFGAKHFVITKDPKNLEGLENQFDLILDTISAPHDLNVYLNLLRTDGALVIVGIPTTPFKVNALPLIIKRRILTGSPIGGIAETQEMLDYCAENNISSTIELIPIQKIEEAYERTIKSDVRYRFVIDVKSIE